MPKLPVVTPTTTFSAVMHTAASTELPATARFSARMVSADRVVEAPDIADDYRWRLKKAPMGFNQTAQKLRPKPGKISVLRFYLPLPASWRRFRMYPVLLIVLIVLSTGVTRAFAQTQSPPASTPSPQKAGVPAQHADGAGEDEMAAPKPDTSTVSPNAPVITIPGLC